MGSSKRGRLTPEPQKTKLVFGQHRLCGNCKGKGTKSSNICPVCGGKGVIDA